MLCQLRRYYVYESNIVFLFQVDMNIASLEDDEEFDELLVSLLLSEEYDDDDDTESSSLELEDDALDATDGLLRATRLSPRQSIACFLATGLFSGGSPCIPTSVSGI
jgi:hypothetical protein